MPGPPPKPAHLRQRANRQPTAARLPSIESSAGNEVPELPTILDDEDLPIQWHRMVRDWWQSVWTSPMASEYLSADMKGGLFQLAALHQDFWTAKSPSARRYAAAEIRHYEVRFGLSPIDRRRLQWAIEQGETAEERTTARRTRKAANVDNSGKADPRAMLRAG